ncbi:hypothetical protein KIL84_006625 [Mauremys mutica]|uniref:Uncharacterized protein n=1 Tax=Mauremys mutica TaxID=74926 RepID=A0A9D3WZP6_9SAUR|nr:hypothetical protein KIL84_006625 [Mauremys mutica]
MNQICSTPSDKWLCPFREHRTSQVQHKTHFLTMKHGKGEEIQGNPEGVTAASWKQTFLQLQSHSPQAGTSYTPYKGYRAWIGREHSRRAMSGFQRAFRLLNATVRNQIVPRANIVSGAPEEIVTPADQAIALTAMFAAFLIPSGWILAHLEDYKNKPSE